MHHAGTIIAIKMYTDAQIFEIADLGIIGEITKIVPELTSLLQERANQGSAQQLAAAETN
jgi:electron transfer flavoprotein alpha subunit